MPKSGSGRKRKAVTGCAEIVFDKEARRAHLTGFAARKRQRRIYGLAMQRVKDRRSAVEHRAELKRELTEQIARAEEQKRRLREAAREEADGGSEEEERRGGEDRPFDVLDVVREEERKEKEQEQLEKMTVMNDVQTQNQWGGQVIVTTSTHFSNSEDEDESPTRKRKKKKRSHDEEQQYAGSVEKYIKQLKGNMPGKKRGAAHVNKRKKGKHGAAGQMNQGDFKVALTALKRSEAVKKGSKHRKKHHGGGKKRHKQK
jgi:hypothetical protein